MSQIFMSTQSKFGNASVGYFFSDKLSMKEMTQVVAGGGEREKNWDIATGFFSLGASSSSFFSPAVSAFFSFLGRQTREFGIHLNQREGRRLFSWGGGRRVLEVLLLLLSGFMGLQSLQHLFQTGLISSSSSKGGLEAGGGNWDGWLGEEEGFVFSIVLNWMMDLVGRFKKCLHYPIKKGISGIRSFFPSKVTNYVSSFSITKKSELIYVLWNKIGQCSVPSLRLDFVESASVHPPGHPKSLSHNWNRLWHLTPTKCQDRHSQNSSGNFFSRGNASLWQTFCFCTIFPISKNFIWKKGGFKYNTAIFRGWGRGFWFSSDPQAVRHCGCCPCSKGLNTVKNGWSEQVGRWPN